MSSPAASSPLPSFYPGLPVVPKLQTTPELSTTTTAMEAIKKKMQAMKVEKDNACDRVDVCEEQCKLINQLISTAAGWSEC